MSQACWLQKRQCRRDVTFWFWFWIYNGFPTSNDTTFPCSAGFSVSAWSMAAMLWHWGERKGFTFFSIAPPGHQHAKAK